MSGIGAGDLVIVGILAAILFGGRLLRVASNLIDCIQAFRDALEAKSRQRERNEPPRVRFVELVTEKRESTMRERFKKFLWSPAFWALLGILGCSTGLYFQRVASNGAGLWCLGLLFLGAAYIEQNT
jgi:Sec-independent protein translocase protein TatA